MTFSKRTAVVVAGFVDSRNTPSIANGRCRFVQCPSTPSVGFDGGKSLFVAIPNRTAMGSSVRFVFRTETPITLYRRLWGLLVPRKALERPLFLGPRKSWSRPPPAVLQSMGQDMPLLITVRTSYDGMGHPPEGSQLPQTNDE